MAGALVILVIVGCIAYQYLKSYAIKTFAIVISAVMSVMISYNFFEPIARFLSRFAIPSGFMQAFLFLILFLTSFVAFIIVIQQLLREDIKLARPADKAVTCILSIFLGMILSGVFLTFIALMPVNKDRPYSRFEDKLSDADSPRKVLFNADAFAAKIFGWLSQGSFSGKQSFLVVHHKFISQLYLNRHKITDKVPMMADRNTLAIPTEDGVWSAPDYLRNASTGELIGQKNGYYAAVVRVGLTDIETKGNQGNLRFTLSQIRAVCRPKDTAAEDILKGSGKAVYPIGYLRLSRQVSVKTLDEEITLTNEDFINDPNYGKIRWLDFVFYVPDGFSPVLVEFKGNLIAKLPSMINADEAPATASFIPVSACGTTNAELNSIRMPIYGIELSSGKNLLGGLALNIKTQVQWQAVELPDSIQSAFFHQEKNVCARADLKMPSKELPTRGKVRKVGLEGPKELINLLQVPDGYALLSLRCNEFKSDANIPMTSEQFPVLTSLLGKIYYPVGVIASGTMIEENREKAIYQFDYCAESGGLLGSGLDVSSDGVVQNSFPESIRINEKAEQVQELYFLYLVPADKGVIIISVGPANGLAEATFKQYEGFLVTRYTVKKIK